MTGVLVACVCLALGQTGSDEIVLSLDVPSNWAPGVAARPPGAPVRPPAFPGAAEEQQAEPPEEEGPLTISGSLLPPTAPPLAVAAAATPAPLPARWGFMRAVQGTWVGADLDDNRLFFTGWIEQSFTGSTAAVSNQPLVWNDRANRYLVQQAWVRFGRSVVTNTTEPSVGFQVDILTGSDYRFTLPRGLFNSQLRNSTGAQNLYGVDPIQHYVSLYVPALFKGVEFRFGRIYTPWGAESNEAISTPLLSRSYAFNWCPPFTHCGGGAYITFNPEWSGVFLLVNGNDVYFGDPSEELRFVGNLKWTQPGGRNSIIVATSVGRGKFNAGAPYDAATAGLANEPAGRNNINVFDLMYTHTFNPVLSYSLEAIYGYQTDVPGLHGDAAGTTAHWFSAAHYLFYSFSPRLTGVLRYENFDDVDGQRTGFTGLYTALTGGIQYKINRGIIIRPELRYDYNGQSAAFDGDRHGLLTAASDLIVRW